MNRYYTCGMWEVVLRRKNGRFVKVLGEPLRSKYKAKKVAESFEEKYGGYILSVEPYIRNYLIEDSNNTFDKS